jgi:hypothetical protein
MFSCYSPRVFTIKNNIPGKNADAFFLVTVKIDRTLSGYFIMSIFNRFHFTIN